MSERGPLDVIDAAMPSEFVWFGQDLFVNLVLLVGTVVAVAVAWAIVNAVADAGKDAAKAIGSVSSVKVEVTRKSQD